jgi:hypothetical protein
MHIDGSLSREMMCRQAATLVVVMVSFVTSRLKRKRPRPDTKPNPLVHALRDEADQHRQQTLDVIYNSNDGECLSMLRMTKAHLFCFMQSV